MVDVFGSIRKAATNVVKEVKNDGAATARKFMLAINDAERPGLSNTRPTRPASFGAEGGIDNIRPLAMLTGLTNQSAITDSSESEAAGREAAQNLIARYGDPLNSSSSPADKKEPVTQFTHDLADHADDPAWQAAYLEELGNERVATLIDHAANPATYGPDAYNSTAHTDNFQRLGDALNSAYENGGIDDAAFNEMYSIWSASNNGQIRPQIADLIAHSSSPGLQEAFVERAMIDWRNASQVEPGGADAQAAAAAASHVLGASDRSQQYDVLGNLETSKELESFLRDAMAGSEESNLNNRNGFHPLDNQFTPATNGQTYGDVAPLFEAVSNASLHYSNSLPPGTVPPFSFQQTNNMVDILFDVGMDGLRDNPAYQNNPKFKDGAALMFMGNFDRLVERELNTAGEFESGFSQDLITYSQYVVFGDPPGEFQSAAAGHLAKEAGELVKAADDFQPGDPDLKIGNHTFADAETAATAAGGLLAHAHKGLELAIGDKADQAARDRAAAEFIVGFGFAFAPGIGDVGSEIAKTALGELYGFALGKTQDEAVDALLGESSNLSTDDFNKVFEEILGEIGDPNPGDGSASSSNASDVNVARGFKNGYDLKDHLSTPETGSTFGSS